MFQIILKLTHDESMHLFEVLFHCKSIFPRDKRKHIAYKNYLVNFRFINRRFYCQTKSKSLRKITLFFANDNLELYSWWMATKNFNAIELVSRGIQQCKVNAILNAFECVILVFQYSLSPVKRFCVFEHSAMTHFNCACPAIQRSQGSGFLSEGSSWFTACMSEQRRFWRDCADAQARLNLRCSHRR